MSNVIIITGPIRSGKTTHLAHLFRNRKDTGGFLTPDVDGVRKFELLTTGEFLPFEVREPLDAGGNITTVGKFHFRSEVFEMANQLMYDFSKSNNKYFIIDEIGKLELKGEGLDRGLTFLFSEMATYTPIVTIVCVVRDELLGQVITKYDIKIPKVCTIDTFFI